MKRYYQIVGLGLGAVLLILPFQYLWIRPFELLPISERSIFLLTNWYEFIIFLALPALVLFFLKKRFIFWFDWLLLAALALAVASSFWSPADVRTDLIGLRYGVGFIVFYLVARSILEWRVNERLLKWVFYSVVAIALVQGLFWLVGVESNIGALARRDLAGDLPRLYGFFIGPNQLATYIVCLGLWLYSRGQLNRWWLIAAVTAAIGTFSRSALLGMLAGAVVLAYQYRHLIQWKVVGVIFAVALLIGGVVIVRYSATLEKTFISQRHADQRLGAFEQSVGYFVEASPFQKFFGHGITTAGPSTFVTDRIFVPENWFFQVLHEIGIIGLLAVVIAIVGALYFLTRRDAPELNSVLAALAVNSLFLHPLADNPAAAITVFVLLAAAVNHQERKGMLKV